MHPRTTSPPHSPPRPRSAARATPPCRVPHAIPASPLSRSLVRPATARVPRAGLRLIQRAAGRLVRRSSATSLSRRRTGHQSSHVLLVDSRNLDQFASAVLARRNADCPPSDAEPVREEFNESSVRRAFDRRRHDTHFERSPVQPSELIPRGTGLNVNQEAYATVLRVGPEPWVRHGPSHSKYAAEDADDRALEDP